MPHLKKDLRQRRKIRRHGSEKAQQMSDVPKRQHCGRHDDDMRQDHNTDTPFAHVAKEERNKQNRMSEGGYSLKVTQKGAHIEFNFG